MTTVKKLSVAALLASSLFTSGAALADGWPASVTGTWNVICNQTAGTLSLVQFAGAVGSQCKPIRGTVYGADAVEGFYCPGSGRIAFTRHVGANTTTVRQHWQGNLSQNANVVRIGGSCVATLHNNVSGTVGGSLGEYNFSGSK